MLMHCQLLIICFIFLINIIISSFIFDFTFAEMEGFQPPHRNDYRPSGFQVHPLQALGYISNIKLKLFYLLKRERDSNPRRSFEPCQLMRLVRYQLLYPAIYFFVPSERLELSRLRISA